MTFWLTKSTTTKLANDEKMALQEGYSPRIVYHVWKILLTMDAQNYVVTPQFLISQDMGNHIKLMKKKLF